MNSLKLIVGLGNPSPHYDGTRHNVGAEWVRDMARRYGITLATDSKFKGEIGRGLIEGVDLRLLVPATYMNLSGESVGAVCRFFKIATEEMLVAYDEMAFDPGVARLKQGGGDNGHNGIKSVRSGCGNDAEFYRLRVGVGHPGDRSRVIAYLTQHKMPVAEHEAVTQALNFPGQLMSDIVNGQWQAAMNALHASGEK